MTSLQALSIPKRAPLPASMDYQLLRTEGLAHIERLASALWTDYNVHDPGITLLELFCYAITDLGYRSSLPIIDLLQPAGDKPLDAKRQAFFTAREILTINPLTILDLRKALIDRPGIKNAWFRVLDSYPIALFANCKTSALQYEPPTAHPVVPQGLYDVQVELETDATLGDLGSGKVTYPIPFSTADLAGSIELRFPSYEALLLDAGSFAPLHSPTCRFTGISDLYIAGNPTDSADVFPEDRQNALRTILYVTFAAKFKDAESGDGTLQFDKVPMRAWFHSEEARHEVTWDQLKLAVSELSISGPVEQYHRAVVRADEVLAEARGLLLSRRNLCEDYEKLRPVPVQDVAVCLDIDVEPSVDIEAVVAEAYDLIDQYMSPDLKFYTLDELLRSGTRVEHIFEGPALSNGFLKAEEVESTEIKAVLYASDIINLLSDIDGVVAIRGFGMTKYDPKGHPIAPTQPWELRTDEGRAPRFYQLASKFLVFKNGLPFLPDRSELRDVLQVFRGRRVRPKTGAAQIDLPVPGGRFVDVTDYRPAQYDLPRTYGVGLEGLPPSVGTERLARAKQLRGYLLIFEQLLVNHLEQLRQVPELFALADTDQTKFFRLIEDTLIEGVTTDFYRGVDAEEMHGMLEDSATGSERKSLFLDHILARFAESFSELSLRTRDKADVRAQLVKDKVALAEQLPEMTRNRARGFDYSAVSNVCDGTNNPTAASNRSGLSLRIQRLLALDPPNDEVIVIEHILLRPRSAADPLLDVCLPTDCATCGEEDPYSFRLTIVLSGESDQDAEDIDFRRYAENTVRREVPAHLGAKVCWVSTAQLSELKTVWCAWLEQLRAPPAEADEAALAALLEVFSALKSVYPPATLHDCEDGNDANRVYLDRTVISGPRGAGG